MISELECINLIRRFAGTQENQYLVKGIGDDCAVLQKDERDYLLLSTDTLVEGVHFDLAWHPPYLLGRKSASVNLSDIAAMGGLPRFCLLNIAFPDTVPTWVEEFITGFTDVLKEFNTLLVGGDTVKGNKDIVITVSVIGEADRAQICYRSGANPGDLIFVSGFLGSAAAGLELCRRGLQNSPVMSAGQRQLVQAHLDPEPLVSLGQILAASGMVGAMMDISDGLATDLAHLCTASKVGAEIKQQLLPVSDMLDAVAAEQGAAVLDWMLKGGEDYQLLFTAKPADEIALRQLVAERTGREIFCIGHIVQRPGVYISDEAESREISYQGFDHFRK